MRRAIPFVRLWWRHDLITAIASRSPHFAWDFYLPGAAPPEQPERSDDR